MTSQDWCSYKHTTPIVACDKLGWTIDQECRAACEALLTANVQPVIEDACRRQKAIKTEFTDGLEKATEEKDACKASCTTGDKACIRACMEIYWEKVESLVDECNKQLAALDAEVLADLDRYDRVYRDCVKSCCKEPKQDANETNL